MRVIAALCLLALAATPAGAQGFSEPPRGSQLRTDLMDAIRPVAEWHLGAPVEFVVWDLRVAADVAFASLWAQRPGGGEIDMWTTPMARRGEHDAGVGDGPTMQALLRKSGNMWVPVHYAIGPTDAWYAWDEYCPIWGAVLPESCP